MWPTRIDCIAGSMSAAIKKEGQEGMKDIQSSEESWQGAREEHMVDASVEVSGQIILECSGCGERLFLLGREEDWPKEHRDAFGCGGCGKTVTLAHRLDGTAYSIKSLLQRSIRPSSQGPSLGGSLPFSPH
jgi:hypothetical protein